MNCENCGAPLTVEEITESIGLCAPCCDAMDAYFSEADDDEPRLRIATTD